jgi:hypothetical protein
MRAFAAAFAFAATCAVAVDSTAWPPAPGVEARMHELQQVIIARDSTPAQREAAREELGKLLKSPAGRDTPIPGEKPAAKMAPRAAIEPFPSVVKPANIAPPPTSLPSGVAHVDVIVPPKPVLNPQTGSAPAPAGRFAVDPRTGALLHEAGPGGYVDPRTGQFVPR